MSDPGALAPAAVVEPFARARACARKKMVGIRDGPLSCHGDTPARSRGAGGLSPFPLPILGELDLRKSDIAKHRADNHIACAPPLRFDDQACLPILAHGGCRSDLCWVLLADPLALLLEDRIILSELRLALPGGVAIRTAGWRLAAREEASAPHRHPAPGMRPSAINPHQERP
jgi:hypothetical protein